MTEKRFEYDKGSRIMIDNKTTLHYIMTLDWECRLVTKLLNDFAEENEQLKQQKDKWKQQCIHFKEMLDDMDIAYLCDEWIYEELKGDV